MEITITSGSQTRIYNEPTGQEAVKMFICDVRDGKISISGLGAIGEWTDGQQDYPFRVLPALFISGLITRGQMCNLFKLADLTFTDAEIDQMVEADTWMVPETVH